MNFPFLNVRAPRALTLTLRATGFLVIAIGGWLLLNTPRAHAAVPVSSITSCETAVAAMNAGLTAVSRSRAALKAAKRSGNKIAIKRAKQRLEKAESNRDVMRAKIKLLCTGGGVSAQAAGCSVAIEKLAKSMDALAAARQQLQKSKTAAHKARVRKIETTVNSQSESMRLACTPVAPAPSPAPSPAPTPAPAADTTPPTVAIGVKTPTNDTTPHVALSANEADVAFSCTLDGSAIATNAELDLPALTEANHTLACSATDTAGNSGPVNSKTIVIDLTPPNVPLVTGPISTQSTHLTFAVSPQAAGDTAQCRADSDPYVAAMNESFTHDFTIGVHHVNCILTDAAGNASLPSDLQVVVLP